MPLPAVTSAFVPQFAALRFGAPVACVYNPLDYAWELHRAYLDRFGRGPKRVLLLGMNPGPFGMVQTGVPFGEVEAVRSWLGLRGVVRRPAVEHPRRPVEGLDCRRSEVSGRRLWGWAARRFITPKRFFAQFFVHNYCPLAFVDQRGANLTPDKLRRDDAEPLFALCDRLLARVAATIRPEWVVGVGVFAAARAEAVLGSGVRIGRIPHPSPANPTANRGWEEAVKRSLHEQGIGC